MKSLCIMIQGGMLMREGWWGEAEMGVKERLRGRWPLKLSVRRLGVTWARGRKEQ